MSEAIIKVNGVAIGKMQTVSLWTWIAPTAIELWNDKKFIEKRIEEQEQYLIRLEDRRYSNASYDSSKVY